MFKGRWKDTSNIITFTLTNDSLIPQISDTSYEGYYSRSVPINKNIRQQHHPLKFDHKENIIQYNWDRANHFVKYNKNNLVKRELVKGIPFRHYIRGKSRLLNKYRLFYKFKYYSQAAS